MAAVPTSDLPYHELLEHTGEIRLRIHAADRRELFAEAGRALAGLLLRGRAVGKPGAWAPVSVEAADGVGLLVDWLNELIYLAESTSAVPVDFDVREAGETRVSAQVRSCGVPEPPALVKAATLHGARVVAGDGKVEADVVLDV
ncbi:MAG: archease [Gemmatimonadales bacterium]